MKLRVGFVGIGGISAVHLQHVHEHEQAAVEAVCSTNADKAKAAAVQYGASAYANYEDMLDNESLDALFVCVPPTRHEQIEEKAAERGIHLRSP